MIRASFNPQPLQRKLQNRRRGFKRDLPAELRAAGRAIAQSLAFRAQPFDITDASLKSGEAATASDIRRCYATPGQVYEAFPDKGKAGGFWTEMKAGNFVRAQRIMQAHCPKFASKDIRPFDDGAAHRANRNSRGRVSKNQESVFVVQSPSRLTAYVNDQVDRVGEGKGGWAACAKDLGGSRLPHWINRHAGKLSIGLVEENQSDPDHPFIRMTNQVPYAQDILSEGDKQIAVREGVDRLAKGIFEAERRNAAANRL